MSMKVHNMARPIEPTNNITLRNRERVQRRGDSTIAKVRTCNTVQNHWYLTHVTYERTNVCR